MSFDPHKIAERFRDDGLTWADRDGAASLLEETKKTLRSQIALGFLPDAGSVSKAEMMAEAKQEYTEHIRSMVTARTEANKARAQYDADRAFIDLVRSQESSRRAEMNLR